MLHPLEWALRGWMLWHWKMNSTHVEMKAYVYWMTFKRQIYPGIHFWWISMTPFLWILLAQLDWTLLTLGISRSFSATPSVKLVIMVTHKMVLWWRHRAANPKNQVCFPFSMLFKQSFAVCNSFKMSQAELIFCPALCWLNHYRECNGKCYRLTEVL